MQQDHIDVIRLQLLAEAIDDDIGVRALRLRDAAAGDPDLRLKDGLVALVLQRRAHERMAAVQIGHIEEADAAIERILDEGGELIASETRLIRLAHRSVHAGAQRNARDLQPRLAQGHEFVGIDRRRGGEGVRRESRPGEHNPARACHADRQELPPVHFHARLLIDSDLPPQAIARGRNG